MKTTTPETFSRLLSEQAKKRLSIRWKNTNVLSRKNFGDVKDVFPPLSAHARRDRFRNGTNLKKKRENLGKRKRRVRGRFVKGIVGRTVLSVAEKQKTTGGKRGLAPGVERPNNRLPAFANNTKRVLRVARGGPFSASEVAGMRGRTDTKG